MFKERMITSNYLYDKKVELTFNPMKHAYYLAGERVPSVTAILSVINKPALIGWAAGQAVEYIRQQIEVGKSYDEVQLETIFREAKNAHNRTKAEAATVGSLVHDWIEKWIKAPDGEKPKLPDNEGLFNAVTQFLKWKDEHQVEFLVSEQVVFSQEHNYCGTLDFIARIQGELVIGDIKTSSAIYDEYFLQTAAYQVARTEEFPTEVYGGQGIIRIGKKGEFEFRLAKNHEDNFKAFIAAKDLYLHIESLKRSR